MRLVLDNTVMSNFALVGRTHWLREVWPGMLVTSEEAWAELQAGVKLGRIPQVDWSWLTVLSLTEVAREARDELMPPLDGGEAACLALARSQGYGFLSDDRVARREARRLGVPLSGTIGVLKSLANEGYVSFEEADEVLQQMIALGYHSPVQSLSELRCGWDPGTVDTLSQEAGREGSGATGREGDGGSLGEGKNDLADDQRMVRQR